MAERRVADSSGRVKRGRPKKNLDPDFIYELATIGCTQGEIAYLCGFNPSYFSEMVNKDPDLKAIIECGYADMRQSLRRTQISVAQEDRSVPMLIHLGKNILSQTEKLEIDANVEEKSTIEINFGDEITPKAKKSKLAETAQDAT